MKKIAFHNLGCKVNSYELDYMTQKSASFGYELVDFEQKADVYIVNTCSVTNIADRKSRQMIHKAKKENPEATVVAVGCFVQANPEEVMKDEAIDLIVGNNKKKEIFELLSDYFEKKEITKKDEKKNSDKSLEGKTLTDIMHCEYEEIKVSKSEERSRAYVKIQDGCNRYCTYCIIPYTRGNIRSRKPENVIEEIENLSKAGYKEVVLTGIHISSYGKDFGGEKEPEDYLYELMKEIDKIDGIERIRIGSFEPMILSEEFVSNLSKVKKLCPHFHISLQSGCNTVLKRMNRHYDVDAYFEKTLLLRKYYEGCAITTDVIVGFPGETEEEFAETVEYLKKVKFFETHIFPYSRRKGTIADRMEGQLSANEKKERVRVLLELDRIESENFRQSKIGSETNIIVEETKEIEGKTYYVGHTPEYIMTAIDFSENEEKIVGEAVKVRIERSLTEGIVYGERIR